MPGQGPPIGNRTIEHEILCAQRFYRSPGLGYHISLIGSILEHRKRDTITAYTINFAKKKKKTVYTIRKMDAFDLQIFSNLVLYFIHTILL